MKRDTSPGAPASGSFLSTPVSRRAFLHTVGATAAATAALGPIATAAAADTQPATPAAPTSPGTVPVTLSINGERRTFSIEPRVTLLEVIREHAGLTGPKEVCEHATCGACTVLLDDIPVYACMMLAVECDGREVLTVEGLSRDGLTPIQQAIVEHDGLQCGYCTPGFVMTLTALLKKNPNPTEAEIRKACSGHLCRCGSYPRVFAAALALAKGNTRAASPAA